MVETALTGMNCAAHKLRSLARQARAMSGRVSDRQRVRALEALARLYEQQAQESEASKLLEPTRCALGGKQTLAALD
jgi:hypothetical protein